MHELYGYPKDTGLFHPNCKCRAVSSVESWKEKWDAAAKAKVVEKQIAAQTRKEANERAEWILDAIQAALNWTGPAGDITNAILYAARGQYDQATLSLASALVPLSITGWGKLAEGTVDAGKYQKLVYGIDAAVDASKQMNLESAGGIIEGIDEAAIDASTEVVQRVLKAEDFVPSAKGYYGVKGKGKNIRIMEGGLDGAKEFFEHVSRGYVSEKIIPGHGYVRMLDDGSYITYRYLTSSPNSPAVEINYANKTNMPYQKIHFITKHKGE